MAEIVTFNPEKERKDMSTRRIPDQCLQIFKRLLYDRQNKFVHPCHDVELDQKQKFKKGRFQVHVSKSFTTAKPLSLCVCVRERDGDTEGDPSI